MDTDFQAGDLVRRVAEFGADPAAVEFDNEGRRVYTALAYTYDIPDTYNTTLAKGSMAHVTVDDFRILEYHEQNRDPVGKPVSIEETSDGPVVKFVFADTERAKELQSLVDGGFLRAVSVGFIPLDGYSRGDGVQVFTKADLLELSLVNAPASKGALIQLAREVGQDPEQLAALFPEVRCDDACECADCWCEEAEDRDADVAVIAGADLEGDADGEELARMVERLRELGVADDILARITDDEATVEEEVQPSRDSDADERQARILRNLALLRVRR
jgi:HK97 family phage prohead protease